MFVFLVIFVYIRHSYSEGLLLQTAVLPREPCTPLETAPWLLMSQIKIVDMRRSHGGMNGDCKKILFSLIFSTITCVAADMGLSKEQPI